MNTVTDICYKKPPSGVEECIVIAPWQSVAETYDEAVEMVLARLTHTYDGKLMSVCRGRPGPQHLRQSIKSLMSWESLQDRGDGNVLLPVQCGALHKNESVRHVRFHLQLSEFCLGIYEVGMMLLEHPERLKHKDDLGIDCGGDEYHDEVHSLKPFDHVPFFRFRNGGLQFGVRSCEFASEGFGSATGWTNLERSLPCI